MLMLMLMSIAWNLACPS